MMNVLPVKTILSKLVRNLDCEELNIYIFLLLFFIFTHLYFVFTVTLYIFNDDLKGIQ